MCQQNKVYQPKMILSREGEIYMDRDGDAGHRSPSTGVGSRTIRAFWEVDSV